MEPSEAILKIWVAGFGGSVWTHCWHLSWEMKPYFMPFSFFIMWKIFSVSFSGKFHRGPADSGDTAPHATRMTPSPLRLCIQGSSSLPECGILPCKDRSEHREWADAFAEHWLLKLHSRVRVDLPPLWFNVYLFRSGEKRGRILQLSLTGCYIQSFLLSVNRK